MTWVIKLLEDYYNKKLRPRNLPYDPFLIKFFVEEDMRKEYNLNRNIRKDVRTFILNLNLIPWHPKILFKLKEYRENLENSFSNLVDIENCMDSLDIYGFKFNFQKHSRHMERTIHLSSYITDMLDNYELKNSFFQSNVCVLEEKVFHIQPYYCKNDILEFIKSQDFASEAKNELDFQRFIVDFKEENAISDFDNINSKDEKFFFYVFIIILVLFGIFNVFIIGKKFRKFEFFKKNT